MSIIRRRVRKPGDWARDGWSLVAGFLSPDELAALRSEADRLWAQTTLFELRGDVPNSPTRKDRLDPVIDLSEPFAALARNRTLLGIASKLLTGEPQLLKDKFIAKPPGASGYGAHQDGAYWLGMGIDPGRFLTAVLFLDDCTADNGPIECAAGRHARLLTDPASIADLDEQSLATPFASIEARAGDLLLLHALTPHRSGPNRSGGMRRTLLFTYGVDARPDIYAIYRQWRRGGASHPIATALVKN